MRRDAHLKGGLLSWQMIGIRTNSKVDRAVSPAKKAAKPANSPVSRTSRINRRRAAKARTKKTRTRASAALPSSRFLVEERIN